MKIRVAFSVSIVVVLQIPILLARVRFPDGEFFIFTLIFETQDIYYHSSRFMMIESHASSSHL